MTQQWSKVRVEVTEYEREPGWCSQRTESRHEFDMQEEAARWVEEYNHTARATNTPDLYYRARIVG